MSRYVCSAIAKLIGKDGEYAYEKIWDIACNAGRGFDERGDIIPDWNIRLKALQFMVEQYNGKARQQIHVTQSDENSRFAAISALTTEQKEKLVEMYEAAVKEADAGSVVN